MTTYFETKEQYLTFRKAWADATNDPRAKKTLVEVKNRQGGIDRVRKSGWLTASHQMLYNILRGRSFDTGFTPVTNATKLRNGAYLNYSLVMSRMFLNRHINDAKKAVKDGDVFGSDSLQKFLEPFDGTVTIQMLAAVLRHRPLPDVEFLESNYGKGQKIAHKILMGEAKPTTFEDLQKLYDEVA